MNQFQKTPRIRIQKILDAVEGQPCYLNFPEICMQIENDETVVPCHSPFREDNQGASQKSHDFLVVPGCRVCHDFLDGRTHAEFSREEKAKHYHLALKKWWEYLFRTGVIE